MQAGPWLYDFKRAFTSKATIIIAIVIVALEGVIAYNDFVGYATSAPGSSQLIAGSVPTTVMFSLAFYMPGDNLFIDLLLILVAYSVFGNDRISGVLDSVLVQPISRTGLVLSRYLAVFSAAGVAAVGSFLVIDLILRDLNGVSFPQTFLATMILTYLAGIASLLGIFFVISYSVKSSAILIGLGLGLWFLLDFLWLYVTSAIAGLVGAGSNGIFSGSYIQASIISYFLNPTQLSVLAYEYSLKWFEMNSPINPASYGVTLYSIVAAAALWVFIPLVYLLHIVKTRD